MAGTCRSPEVSDARPGSSFARRATWLAATQAPLLAACGARGTRADASLYEEVGGDAGIERIVTPLVARLFADPRAAPLYEDTDRADAQRLIEEQF